MYNLAIPTVVESIDVIIGGLPYRGKRITYKKV